MWLVVPEYEIKLSSKEKEVIRDMAEYYKCNYDKIINLALSIIYTIYIHDPNSSFIKTQNGRQINVKTL
jgi:hypothetical protein